MIYCRLLWFILENWQEAGKFCIGRRKGIPPTAYADHLVKMAIKNRNNMDRSDDESDDSLSEGIHDQNSELSVTEDENIGGLNESIEAEGGHDENSELSGTVDENIRNPNESIETETDDMNDSVVGNAPHNEENTLGDDSLHLEDVFDAGEPIVKNEWDELPFNRNNQSNDELFGSFLDDSFIQPLNDSVNSTESSDDDDDEVQLVEQTHTMPKPFVITDDIYNLVKRENDIFSGSLPFNEKVGSCKCITCIAMKYNIISIVLNANSSAGIKAVSIKSVRC